MNDYVAVLKKYAVFSGRARRREYWMFVLFNIIISIVLGILDAVIFKRQVLGGIYSLALLIPSIAVAIRRLHDTSRSGWWYLLIFIPIIGWIALLVFFTQDSKPGDNAYGPNPKGMNAVAATPAA